MAAAVREVAPPEKLAQFYLAVFLHGTDAALMDDELRAIIGGGKVTFADRLKAAEWLTDRGYGKAPIHAPIEGENPLELDSIARRIATVVDELAARREADAAGEAASGQLAGAG